MQFREQPCRRLISGGLPDTAGQPAQVQLHVTLDQLRDLPGAAAAERSWAAARAAGDGTPGWVYSRAAAEGYACDAQLIPVVTGHLDPGVLEAMTNRYLAGFRRPDCQCGTCTCPPGTFGLPGPQCPGARPLGPPPLSLRTRRPLQNTLLAYAATSCPARPASPRSCAPACSPATSPGTAPSPAEARPLPSASPDPAVQGRRHRAPQRRAVVHVPSPHRRASLGLGPRPQRRRHHHRDQPGRQTDLSQPRATWGNRGLDQLLGYVLADRCYL